MHSAFPKIACTYAHWKFAASVDYIFNLAPLASGLELRLRDSHHVVDLILLEGAEERRLKQTYMSSHTTHRP